MVPAEVLRRRLTLADYEALPDDQEYEIIDGVLYVAPSPFYGHQTILFRLARRIADHADMSGLGQVVLDADLIVDDRGTYISPDVMFFTPEQYARTNPDGKNSVIPELIVEVLSESTLRRDQVVKRDAYARLGVPHYWIVSRAERCIAELILGAEGQYAERQVVTPEQFRPALFPGLAIDLGRLFA
jgi:Uma2 family endonuclease